MIQIIGILVDMGKRVFFSVVACLILASCAIALKGHDVQASAPEGFRGSVWGITMDAVRATEKGAFVKEQAGGASGLKILTYKGTAVGIECYIGYYFAGGALVEGRYVLLASHQNKNLYIDDFKTADTSLAEKYGTAAESNSLWRNALYKDDPSEWGMAVSLGHLVYETNWKLPGTKVQHLLYGDNFKITHAVDFQSIDPAHVKLIEEARKNASKTTW